jgi:hypothetical protein
VVCLPAGELPSFSLAPALAGLSFGNLGQIKVVNKHNPPSGGVQLRVQLLAYWLGINLTSQLAMHFTVCSSISAFFREEPPASGMMIIDCGPSATLNEQSKVID